MDMEVDDDGSAPAATAVAGPSQTVYVRNLNEKVKKQELRKALYTVFTKFGKVLDVVAMKTLKMRGQAFIVYADVTSATAAMRGAQGLDFFGKAMVLQYAKTKSDRVAKLDGTFVPREKRPKVQAAKDAADKKTKFARESENGSSASAAPTSIQPDPNAAPNKILFVQNLPPASDASEISQLFKQFAGFTEVRLVPGNAGIAFVEFHAEPEATMALSALQGFKYLEYAMTISYAKQG